MIKVLRKLGITSQMLYAAGFGSIGLSIASWWTSRNVESAGIDRADRWGIFVGQWAPTFFALGNAMQMEEQKSEPRPVETAEQRARETIPVG